MHTSVNYFNYNEAFKTITTSSFSSLVTSKNIFDLESLKQGLQDEETVNNDKREPVNLLYLDRFKMGVSDEAKGNAKFKRDPKNVIDPASLKEGSAEEEQKDKREPKIYSTCKLCMKV